MSSYPPSKRPSKYPASSNWVEPTRSIRPSQPRLRIGIATVCSILFGMSVVSAFVRACEGGDPWEPQSQRPQEQHDHASR